MYTIELTHEQREKITIEYLENLEIKDLDKLIAEQLNEYYEDELKLFKKTLKVLKHPLKIS